MELAERFGHNVRRIRRSRNLTIESLAHDAKLSYSYVGELERGSRNPTLMVVSQIAKALGVEPDELFV